MTKKGERKGRKKGGETFIPFPIEISFCDLETLFSSSPCPLPAAAHIAQEGGEDCHR